MHTSHRLYAYREMGSPEGVYAQLVSKAWPILILLVPTVCIIFVIVGLPGAEIEDSVFELWTRETSSFGKDREDADHIISEGKGVDYMRGTSLFSGILVPRDGGNIMTAVQLLEHRDRLLELEQVTVNVDGITYTLDDICANFVEPYVLPCVRMSVLDCFEEGGYNFGEKASVMWRALMKSQINFEAEKDRLYKPIVLTGFANIMCISQCVLNPGSLAMHPSLLNMLGTPGGEQFEADHPCAICCEAAYNFASDSFKDTIYYQVVQMAIPIIDTSGNTTIESLKKTHGVTTRGEALDAFVMQIGENAVDQQLAGKTPYTFQTHPEDLGVPRPSLGNRSNPMNTSEVLRISSKICYNWVHLLPPNVPILLYGQPSPNDHFNGTEPLTSVKALGVLYFLTRPANIVQTVKNPNRPGGPLDINIDTAMKVVEEYKFKMEQTWYKGWDDPNDGLLETTCVVDDAGGGGTFRRVLKESSKDTNTQMILYIISMFCVSALAHASCSCVETSFIAAFCGTASLCLCVFGSFGLTAMCGAKLNAVHFWTLPFLLLGIGIDDMFLVSNAAATSLAETPVKRLEAAISEIWSPVTMTSLMNVICFSIMALASDLPAVYLAGCTGIMGVGLCYSMVITFYVAVTYLDLVRKDSRRMDGLCCLKSNSEEKMQPTASGYHYAKERNYIFRYVFRPAMSTIIGRVACLLLTVALLTVALVFLPKMGKGIQMSDFFPANTPEGRYADLRAEYFPSYPISINWLDVKYEDPEAQLQMALQWERVLSTDHVADNNLSTGLVWTAALALWALPCPEGGTCGPRVTNGICNATLKNNTYGLKSTAENGICTEAGCPVIEGLSQEQLVQCITAWRRVDPFGWQLLDTGVLEDLNGSIKLPIRYSRAGGTTLFATKLNDNDDMMRLIEQTRQYTDEDDSIGRTYMNGIPYGFFEQYLEVTDFIVRISGYALLFMTLVAWLFLFVHFTSGGPFFDGILLRIVSTIAAAALLAIIAGMSLLTTLGYLSAFDINLNGFTAMAALLSIGLSVEYSVHVVHRFFLTPGASSLERMLKTMEFLMVPMCSGFMTTAISVTMMGFAEFQFVRKYYFAPLMITTLVTFFYGMICLPVLLSFCPCLPVLMTKTKEVIEKNGCGAIEDPNPVTLGSPQMPVKEPQDLAPDERPNPERTELNDVRGSPQVDDDEERVKVIHQI